MNSYLTKSLFKLALECETKLYYKTKKLEYADLSTDDTFLAALAEGGYQVGELAKYYHCDNPVSEQITIDTLDYNAALSETQSRINAGKKVIAEAAFCHENLFIRTDILEIDTETRVVNFYEVKAKSFDKDKKFSKRKNEKIVALISSWIPYLYDVAFQTYVLKKVFPDYNINPHLTLADKSKVATVDGLNQMFRIYKAGNRIKIVPTTNLNRSMLGKKILIDKPVKDEVNWIIDNPVKTDLRDNISFEEYINLLSVSLETGSKLVSPIGSKCRNCQFQSDSLNTNQLKNGHLECWQQATGLSTSELQKPLVTSLWSQGFNGINNLIKSGIYLLENVEETMITPKSDSKTDYPGLTPLKRRMLQIEKIKNNDNEVFIDKEGLKKEMASWKYPLHFIDFETSRVALPFHSGRKPYEQIAFQFSHHIVLADQSIIHAGEYLFADKSGHFPNYEFVRALKTQLDKDSGTVFRYHNHENSVLNEIYDQLQSELNVVEDKVELLEFIRSITHRNETKKSPGWIGNRDMVDLYKLVVNYYFPPTAGGSNSLKYILPATIAASSNLQDKYSQPVYGSNLMPSRNFTNMVWLHLPNQLNPYKSLPPIFETSDEEQLDGFYAGMDQIAEGGAAMTAYTKLQFTDVPPDQKDLLRKALLKYCELDTLAMVMIWEYWMDELNNSRL